MIRILAKSRDNSDQKAWRASERGELVLAGALADPVDGAVLLFHGDSPEVAEKFAKADPYVTSGIVRRWQVREWTTMVYEGDAGKQGRRKRFVAHRILRSIWGKFRGLCAYIPVIGATLGCTTALADRLF